MKFARLYGVMALVLMTLQSLARADLVLEFGQGGTIGLTSFEAKVGDSINVDLYITQKGNEARLTTRGLATMAMKFTIDGNGGATHGDLLSNIPTHFDNVIQNTLSVDEQVLIVDAVNTTGSGLKAIGSNSILLGTATIRANQLGLYNFNLGLPEDPGVLSFTLAGLPLTFIIPDEGNAIFNVTAVPEPGSLATLAMCVALGIGARFRRHKRSVS
jgi:hypothetical protein